MKEYVNRLRYPFYYRLFWTIFPLIFAAVGLFMVVLFPYLVYQPGGREIVFRSLAWTYADVLVGDGLIILSLAFALMAMIQAQMAPTWDVAGDRFRIGWFFGLYRTRWFRWEEIRYVRTLPLIEMHIFHIPDLPWFCVPVGRFFWAGGRGAILASGISDYYEFMHIWQEKRPDHFR